MDARGRHVIWVMTTLSKHPPERCLSQSGDNRGHGSHRRPRRGRGRRAAVDSGCMAAPTTAAQCCGSNPESGEVDLPTIPVGGAPGWANWLGDSLWVGRDQADVDPDIRPRGRSSRPRFRASSRGAMGLAISRLNDPGTDLISSLSESGTPRRQAVYPTPTRLKTMSGSGIRQVAKPDGRLFLLDGDYPWGTNLNVYNPLIRASSERFCRPHFRAPRPDRIRPGDLWVTSQHRPSLDPDRPLQAASTRVSDARQARRAGSGRWGRCG